MSQMSTYDHSENFMDTFSGQDEKVNFELSDMIFDYLDF